MKCQICGTENPIEAKFCNACGTRFSHALHLEDELRNPVKSSNSRTPETCRPEKVSLQKGVRRYARIGIAMFVCAAIYLLWTMASMAFGLEHFGGVIPMAIMLTMIAFVWRKIVTGHGHFKELGIKVSILVSVLVVGLILYLCFDFCVNRTTRGTKEMSFRTTSKNDNKTNNRCNMFARQDTSKIDASARRVSELEQLLSMEKEIQSVATSGKKDRWRRALLRCKSCRDLSEVSDEDLEAAAEFYETLEYYRQQKIQQINRVNKVEENNGFDTSVVDKHQEDLTTWTDEELKAAVANDIEKLNRLRRTRGLPALD